MEKNNVITAIQTEYKGHCFDSRLEARWAVFFDACGVDWEYRPTIFNLGDGIKYCPDFLLHKVVGRFCGDLYVEVKGQMDSASAAKIDRFTARIEARRGEADSKPILIVGNIPNGNLIGTILGNIRKSSRIDENGLSYYSFETIDGKVGTAIPGISKFGGFKLFNLGGDDEFMDLGATAEAYRKARQFKFESREEVQEIMPSIPATEEVFKAILEGDIIQQAYEYNEKAPDDGASEASEEMCITHDTRIIAQVYETSNYDQFKKLDFNRDVLKSRKEKLMASFEKGRVLNPIVVNEKMEIIDGQGRYEALKELGEAIQYVIAPGSSIDDCRRMNQYNQKWTVHDWVISYANGGNLNYAILEDTRIETGLDYNVIARLAGKSIEGAGRTDVLCAGKMLFTQEDAIRVKNLKRMASEIAEALTYEKRLNKIFYSAVKIACEFPGYKHNRMLSNCKKCRGSYNQMGSIESQLKEFSRIYNYKQTGKNKLYFERYMENRGYNVRGYSDNTDSSCLDDVSTLR